MRRWAAMIWLVSASCAANAPVVRDGFPYVDPSTLEKGQILHVRTGTFLTETALAGYLSEVPVVYVGESHDSLDDHAVELQILEGLAARRPGAVALGLEMLRHDTQPQVDAFLSGALDEAGFRKVFEESWGPHSWPYYRDLLLFARDHGVPVVALNADRDLVQAVMMKGLDGLDAAERARLPEMRFDDPYHRAVVEAVWAGHGAGHAGFERFYAVQVLWDETMAQSAARFLEGHEGVHQLMICAGGYHVQWGVGIPRRLFRRLPRPYAIVMPWTVEVPPSQQDKLMDIQLPELPMAPADVLWGVGYTSLPEPGKAEEGATPAKAGEGASDGDGGER